MIAEPVQWGHAVWCADLDSDGDDELIVGQRDPNKPGAAGPKGPGVFVFDIKRGASPLAFDRHTIDDGGMACEDAVAADLDGDGRMDIIAGGRATHNVKIYWNRSGQSTVSGQWSVVGGVFSMQQAVDLVQTGVALAHGGERSSCWPRRWGGPDDGARHRRRRARPIPRSMSLQKARREGVRQEVRVRRSRDLRHGDTRSSRHWS